MKKIISKTIVLLFLILGLINIKTSAQGLSSEQIRSELAADWQRAKDYTNEYLTTMPAGKYSYKAVDSLRSFAQQMLHLATANVYLMATATDAQLLPWASFGLEGRTTAQSHDSVVYYVNASYDFCIDAVKKSDVSKWAEKKKVFGFEATRFGFMQKTFEHQTHHRGQTTIYIRLLNIKPPQEKLF